MSTYRKIFFDRLACHITTTTQPTASFTPNFDNTAQRIEKADRTEQEALRESVRSLILSCSVRSAFSIRWAVLSKLGVKLAVGCVVVVI